MKMPFPYELYPKAKETHCLNLPEISVSRPPFPGSIRTADGCFWGERDNNSYVSDNGNTYLGSGYYWSDVFEEYTTADARMECGSVPNNGRGCYIGCTCKSGWDGKKTYGAAASGLNQTGTINANSAPTSNSLSAANVLDAAPSANSAVGNYSATAASASAVVASSSASGINSGISAMAAGGSCSVSFSDGRYGTTCSKSGTFACPSGYGYSLDSCKKNQETKYQVCSVDSTQTNSTPCYSAGTAKTCSDENPSYVSQCPSGQSGTQVTTPCGNTCYKDCKVTCSGTTPYESRPDCDKIKGNDWYEPFKSGNCWGCALRTCNEYFGCSDSNTPATLGCAADQHPANFKKAPWGNEQCCGECVSNTTPGGGAKECSSNLLPYYKSNGELCCCADLNWVGGCSGDWCIPTSCMCYGTARP